jgi:hypothetical protein
MEIGIKLEKEHWYKDVSKIGRKKSIMSDY